MLTALILICSLTSVPDLGGCTRENAVEMLQVPATFASPVACLWYGQAYLAQSSIGRDLAENEAVKVICVQSGPRKFGALPLQGERAASPDR
jgi:hypothetical protein